MVIKIALENIRDIACRTSLVCVVISGARYPSVIVLDVDLSLWMLEPEEAPWECRHEILSALRSAKGRRRT